MAQKATQLKNEEMKDKTVTSKAAIESIHEKRNSVQKIGGKLTKKPSLTLDFNTDSQKA